MDFVVEMRTWEGMRERIHAQLQRQTGEGVDRWNREIAAAALADEDALRAWLTERGVTGYPQMLLVYETFGYPDFLLATADELLDAQYADRPQLRPIFDAILLAMSDWADVDVQARKTYVSLVGARRTFAIVRASTKKRVDLGLRLPDVEPAGRLLPAPSLGNDTITRRIALEQVEDLDVEAIDWLRRAYEENR